MAKKYMSWVEAKDKGKRRGKKILEFKCVCGNRLLRVLKEPVLRKERKMTSHEVRIAAWCPLCGNDTRIVLGGNT
jgi:hypothetical protein